MNALQKITAQAIVNVFETGNARGDYGKVTLLKGDTGRLTYGRSQTTLASGNLHRLIRDYVKRPDARCGKKFAPYLPRLDAKDPGLDDDAPFRLLLEQAGEDPVMQRVQDDFFDRVYWYPAVRSATRLGIGLPLGVAVVYDSHIHGSWGRVRRLTEKKVGLPAGGESERRWITRYVETRRAWLASRQSPLLRRTVYRMDAFLRLIAEDRWELQLPFEVRGIRLAHDTLLPPEVNAIANAPSTGASAPPAENSDPRHKA